MFGLWQLNNPITDEGMDNFLKAHKSQLFQSLSTLDLTNTKIKKEMLA